MIGFMVTTYTALSPIYTILQLIVAQALGFSVSTSRLLATGLNTETSTSTHYEVFLLFFVQSPWYLGTQLKLSSQLQVDSCYIAAARGTQKTQFYCCVAQTTQKTLVT
jgi:hypothetical protein